MNSNKDLDQFDVKYFDGNWIYRSLYNVSTQTPFSNLEFATAVMRFDRHSGYSFFGVLDMGPGLTLNLAGKLTFQNGVTTFFLQGTGVPNSSTADWQYDYQGYVVPRWKNAVAQVDVCVGSVIRSKPHGNAKAGQTASFYIVKQ